MKSSASPLSRRAFLKQAGAVSALAGGLGVGSSLPGVAAAATAIQPGTVRFSPDIEPLVALLEDTPRERLLEEVGARIKRGVTYREILTALQLAGVRNIQPRPVGFKFHAVLVINSAHIASLNSPESDRWLPIFWAIDQFKSSQARDVAEGDWTLSAVDEARVPAGDKAVAMFRDAMETWDEAKADAAAAGLARSAGANGAFDVLCRAAARDFRDIGHKIIFAANSWRTLQHIGWQHAEPVLRSLAYAMLAHSEKSNPARLNSEADLPGRRNLRLLRTFRDDWTGGRLDADATRSMMEALRHSDSEQSPRRMVELINRGAAPTALWDACFLHAAEMLMRKPGIVSLHASTTANALHYTWQHCGDDETRRFLMLQAASFGVLFRNAAGAGEGIRIEDLPPAETPASVQQVFEAVGSDKPAAARMALGYLERGGDARSLMDEAQRMVFRKGTDSHDYKFSTAIIEDFRNLSPKHRNRFLAASTYWLKGSKGNDSSIVARTMAAMS